MINNVTLVGRLVAPPDLRKMPNNVSSLQGTLAVNRNFKNQNGERRYVTEVIAETVTLLEKRSNNQNNQNSNPSNGYNSPFAGSNPLDLSDDDLPF